jgi:hypothetical protein
VSDERDETVDRVAAALRVLPEVDPSARARLLVAVAAERARGRESAPARRRRAARRAAARRRWAAALATLAAGIVGLAWLTSARGARAGAMHRDAGATPTAAASLQPGPPVVPAAADAAALARQPVELVFRAPAARRVSVVGDFTAWDHRRAEMSRDAGSGLWSVRLALTPGRHVYAFLVDDTLWVRDPRAPVAPDADFGRPGSVLLVGRP